MQLLNYAIHNTGPQHSFVPGQAFMVHEHAH